MRFTGPSLCVALSLCALPGLAVETVTPERAQQLAGVDEVLSRYTTQQALLAYLGGVASCTEISPDAAIRICTWNVGNRNVAYRPLAKVLGTGLRVFVVCWLPVDGGMRAPDSCRAYTSHRGSVSPSASAAGYKAAERRNRKGVPTKRRWQQESQAMLDGARTLRELVELVGSGPRRCWPREVGVTCLWRLDSSTPGYVTIARIVGVRKKLHLTCDLPDDGGPRSPGSCRVEVGD